MKRILILANLDIGLYKFRKDLLAELLKHGHEVYISLPRGELVDNLEEMGCRFVETPVDRRGINPLTDIGLLARYRKLLKEVQPDLTITYTIKPNIYGGFMCRIAHVPYAVNITGLGTAFQNTGLLKRLVVFLYRIACQKAETVFFENRGNAETFLTEKIVDKEQICLLDGAGINLTEYPLVPYPEETEGVRFLFIGRVMREKGVDELFEAMKKLKEIYPDTKLDIVGPYEDDYQSVIEELENSAVIQYHGYQKDVKPYIAKCHCFVLPSWHEGMANTLLEAGAMGRPLITTDIYGCREAVKDGENGLLVKRKSEEDLLQKMRAFAELSHKQKIQLGTASRKRMEVKFDKKVVVEATVRRLGV